VLDFFSSTLRPSGFFSIDVDDTANLLSTFAKAIEQNGRALFLGEDGLVDDLSTDDVRLICTLAWLADGNEKRQLPEFRFVYDPKSASQLESGLSTKPQNAGMLVVTTDHNKKSRIKFIIESDKLTGITVASITGSTEGTDVESIFISYTKNDENW